MVPGRSHWQNGKLFIYNKMMYNECPIKLNNRYLNDVEENLSAYRISHGFIRQFHLLGSSFGKWHKMYNKMQYNNLLQCFLQYYTFLELCPASTLLRWMCRYLHHQHNQTSWGTCTQTLPVPSSRPKACLLSGDNNMLSSL